MKKFTVIAIDGGAGTGKSTTSQLISSQFNFLHVDTGSHYRSIAAALINCNISESDALDSRNLNKIELDELNLNEKLYNLLKYESDTFNICILDITDGFDSDEIKECSDKVRYRSSS